MKTVWRLYKDRLLVCIALAMLSGFSFAFWFYMSAHPDVTLWRTLYVGLTGGSALSLFLFFFMASIVIPRDVNVLATRRMNNSADPFSADPAMQNFFKWGTYSNVQGYDDSSLKDD